MLQIMQKPDHWQYAGTAAFFAWLSWRIIRWVWRTFKEVQEEPPGALAEFIERNDKKEPPA